AARLSMLGPAHSGAVEVAVREHPRVYTAAALRRVHDERALTQCDARQAAGKDVDVLAVEDVGAQVDMAAFEVITDDHGSAGEGQGPLSDVVARVGDDAPPELI